VVIVEGAVDESAEVDVGTNSLPTPHPFWKKSEQIGGKQAQTMKMATANGAREYFARIN
jgi:hypothetical protein